MFFATFLNTVSLTEQQIDRLAPVRTREGVVSCGCTGGERHIGSLQAAAYGLANESARPITFGEETVAVWMPADAREEG